MARIEEFSRGKHFFGQRARLRRDFDRSCAFCCDYTMMTET